MAATPSSSRVERAVAEVRRLSHAGLDSVDLLRRTAAAIHPVIPFDGYCASATDPATQLIQRGVAEGMGDDLPDADALGRIYFERVYIEEDLPHIRAMLRAGSTVASLREAAGGDLARSLRYREVLQPYGFASEAGILLVDRGLWGGIDLMRSHDAPDFSLAELDVLRRVAPIAGAGMRAAALRQYAIDAAVGDAGDDAPGVLVVDAARRLRSATPAARRLLDELEPDGPEWRTPPLLPIPVMMVLAALDRATHPASDADRAVTPRLRVRSRSGRWLSLHADLTEPGEDRPGERVVVIAPARPADVAGLTLAAHALTDREGEVVRLVIAGMSTKQMAERLFIAENTVQRHLSNVFEKVGVRSRRELVKRFVTEQATAGMG